MEGGGGGAAGSDSRTQYGADLEVSAPLFPADYESPAHLSQAMFDLVEPGVRAWPEAYTWPRPNYRIAGADGAPLPFHLEPGESEV